MTLKLHVADDLGLQQADGVAGRRIAKARQKLVGDRSAANGARGFKDRDLQALLRQIMSAGQAIMAGANDNRVVQMLPPVRVNASGRVLRPWSGEAQPRHQNRTS